MFVSYKCSEQDVQGSKEALMVTSEIKKKIFS